MLLETNGLSLRCSAKIKRRREMRNILRMSLMIILAGALSACATGEKFVGLEKPDEGKSRVYAYRTFDLLQSGIYPSIHLDSKLVGKLKNGGYFSFSVSPGMHTVSLSGDFLQWHYKDHSFPVAIEPNKTYFYRLKTISNTGYTFTPVEEEEAMKALKKLNAIE